MILPNEFTVIVLLLIAGLNAYSAWAARQTRNDVKTLEVNTNSIKDALVLRTAEASEAKGRDDQRIIGEEKAALLAQGRSEGKLEAKTGGGPVPVSDSRTAKAAESTAESTGRLADATVKIAEASERKK